MDYATGLFIDGSAAVANATNGLLKYKNNLVALAGSTQKVAEDDNSRTVFFAVANSNDSLGSTTGVLVTPYNFTAPDYRPAQGSQALSNYDFAFTGSTLPVSLVNFAGANVKNDNLLSWETKSESNNKGFEI